ncbi:hypothetical protein AAVH_24236 [Aphelenchoides avenae]|nr:hypothetical protein AAVH_24236 [Aphelenchus avenae]
MRCGGTRAPMRTEPDFIEDFPPTASDTTERTAELVKQYRNNITQLKLYANTYDALWVEWDGHADTYDIPGGDSEWATLMRDDHNRFLAEEPNFSAHLRQLIATYRDYSGQMQRSADTLSPLPPSPELGLGVQPTMLHPSRTPEQAPANAGPTPKLRFPENSSDDDEHASTDTTASHGANGQMQHLKPSNAAMFTSVKSRIRSTNFVISLCALKMTTATSSTKKHRLDHQCAEQ